MSDSRCRPQTAIVWANRVEKGPRAGEPPLDLIELLDVLQKAKTLVQETMLRLRGG